VTRVASAAVLVALIGLTIWWLPWWATVLVAAAAAAAAGGELAGLASAVGAAVPSGVAAIGASLATMAFVIAEPASPIFRDNALGSVLLAVMLAAALASLAEGRPAPATLTRAAVVGLAPLYVGLPLGALAWTRVALGPEALTWLIAVIVASDSAQYYTGRLVGRHKLAPAVSPAKTVEGALGGAAAAAAAGALLAPWGLASAGAGTGAVLGVMLAAGGMCGDLFESLLKRSAGVKDSSSLIPGHGGVLDRIDSYLFAAPLFYLYVRHVS
jgi:phosphatidate cytidylyltransferase